jgi:hypothetical protein
MLFFFKQSHCRYLTLDRFFFTAIAIDQETFFTLETSGRRGFVESLSVGETSRFFQKHRIGYLRGANTDGARPNSRENIGVITPTDLLGFPMEAERRKRTSYSDDCNACCPIE